MQEDTTFLDLGIPFPLFDAPVRLAASYIGKERCDLCENENRHSFRLGIGDVVIASCGVCSEPMAFDAHEPGPAICSSCNTEASFPVNKSGDIHVCYDCLRDGRAAFTHDTEFGMVGYEDAVRGLTHGVPGLSVSGYETILSENGWNQVKVRSNVLLELVRTPGFVTWQGERWLFCCSDLMTYVGEWQQADFSRQAKDGRGHVLFNQLCSGEDWTGWTWASLGKDFPGVIYAFRCRNCQTHRVYWDCD